jgi:hypothetical protein
MKIGGRWGGKTEGVEGFKNIRETGTCGIDTGCKNEEAEGEEQADGGEGDGRERANVHGGWKVMNGRGTERRKVQLI